MWALEQLEDVRCDYCHAADYLPVCIHPNGLYVVEWHDVGWPL
jgi:hypothetical protein